MSKVFTNIIRERLEEDVEIRKLLGQMQHGFRKGYRCMDALFILTHLIESQKKKRKNMF